MLLQCSFPSDLGGSLLKAVFHTLQRLQNQERKKKRQPDRLILDGIAAKSNTFGTVVKKQMLHGGQKRQDFQDRLCSRVIKTKTTREALTPRDGMGCDPSRHPTFLPTDLN